MKKPTTLEELKTLLANIPFAIFGGGFVGKRVWEICCEGMNYAPVGFCDNYLSNTDTILGLPVIKPREFVENYPKGIILICVASREATDEIVTQLDKLNFPTENIIKFNEMFKLFNADELKWVNSREHEFDWRKNNGVIEYMATWIEKTDTSVADLGCGKEMHLKKLLPAGCRYIPVDYFSRSDDTVVCDFNGETLPDLKADVVFASGVLQMVEDPFRFLDWMCDVANKKIIIRHSARHRQAEMEINAIKFTGSLSMMSVPEIEKTVTERGFKLLNKEIATTGNPLLCFER